jgi:hypothetical protein
MPDDRPLGMFKFGKRRHIEQFAQGLLYMNQLGYFIKQEADSVRGDPHEGTDHMAQAHGWLLRIKVGEEFKDVGTITRVQISGSTGFATLKTLDIAQL